MVKKSSFVVALALLLILSAPMWAQRAFITDTMFGSVSSVSCMADAGDPYAWITLSFVALMLGVMIAAGTHALSGILGTQKLSDFLKGHMWGIVEGAAILTIFMGVFGGLHNYGVANIDTARAYSVVIRNTLMLDFAAIIMASTVFSFFSSAAPQFRPFGEKIGVYVSFQLAPMFRPIFDLLGMLIQLLSVAILEWFGHEFLLCFVKNQMLTILLPAGFFLRAFGLKAAGNALIGVVLALYFVYPFMLIMVGQIATVHFQNELNSLPPAHLNFPAIYGCSADRPICCVGDDPYPASFSEPYLLNGNDPSVLENRISVEKVNQGPVYLTFNSGGQAGMGSSCIFTTSFGRVVRPVVDFLLQLPALSFFLGAGLAGLGANMIFMILKFTNISWMFGVFALPMSALVLSFTYEMVYFVLVISVVMAVFIIFITLTFAKEVAKVLGTEIDLSALEKLI